MASSSICGSWQAHSGWMFAVAPSAREARHVLRVHDLQVREVVPVAELAVGGERRLDRVERLAHGPVAERVEVHLEAEPVQLGHVAAPACPGR